MRLSFGDFVIDFDERRLLSNDQEIRLTPKAFDLLRFLVESRPKALSKQEISDGSARNCEALLITNGVTNAQPANCGAGKFGGVG